MSDMLQLVVKAGNYSPRDKESAEPFACFAVASISAANAVVIQGDIVFRRLRAA